MKTPEHFKQEIVLGLTQVNRDGIDYKIGYNEALEKTNAKELWIENQKLKEDNKELRDALMSAYSHINRVSPLSGKPILTRIKLAIEKANKL